uniref:Tudor domain-containing protein n=1 Tax=Plectus sambesii TaxID=2011161 RepID=A0A914XR66_9BILA
MGFRLASSGWDLPGLSARPPMSIGDVAQVVISYAFDPGRFYVQFVSDVPKVAKLTDQLTEYYTKGETDDDDRVQMSEEPRAGSLVAAPYQGTSGIFRAQVTKRGSSARGLVVIRYHEYGNECEVRLLHLRKLVPMFKKEPAFALECALYGVKETNKWSPEEIKIFKVSKWMNPSHELQWSLTFRDSFIQDMFYNEIFGKELVMKVAAVNKDDVHLVEFYDGTTNLVQIYLKLLEDSGMPQPLLEQAMPTMVSSMHPVASENIFATPNREMPLVSSYRAVARMAPKVELNPFHPNDLVGQTLKCHLTVAFSPDDFYVRLLAPQHIYEDEFGIALQKIHEQMNRYYGNHTIDRLSNDQLVEGSIVAAKYSVDEGFYRGRVLKTPRDGANAVEVQYVDYGNVELVPADSVFPLLPEFVQSLDALALHCALKNIRPSDGQNEWHQDAINFFREHVEKELDLVVRGVSKRFPGRADVELLNMEAFNQIPMRCAAIAGALQERGLCVRTNDNDSHQAPVHPSSHKSESEDPRRMPYPRIVLPKGLKDNEVAVTEMDDPNAFSVHLSASKERLNKVSTALDEYYGRYATRRPTPIERPAPKGMRCVSKFRGDGDDWYRAEVVADDGDGAIRVHYVDYGNVDDVDPDDVCIASSSAPDINDIPALALKVRIAGVKFDDMQAWRTGLQERVADMVKRCAVELLAVDDDMLYTVAFTERNTGHNLTAHLIDRKLAVVDNLDTAPAAAMLAHGLPYLQVPGLAKMFIPADIGDYLDVVVAYISEQRTVFVQMENRTDELVRLVDQLTSLYSSLPAEENLLVNPRKGQICAAKYTIDEQWYRGSIIERVDPNFVKVMFIDYGNTEVINKNNIKKLNDQLQRFPSHAVELAFARPLPNGLTQQQLGVELENKHLVVKLEREAQTVGGPVAATFFQLNYEANGPSWVDVGEHLTDRRNANNL